MTSAEQMFRHSVTHAQQSHPHSRLFVLCAFASAAAADQCTYDYKGIGVCVEGVDDGCLLAGASMLRGNTLTCLSSSCECRAGGLQGQGFC
jgi:hypothetical protein